MASLLEIVSKKTTNNKTSLYIDSLICTVYRVRFTHQLLTSVQSYFVSKFFHVYAKLDIEI